MHDPKITLVKDGRQGRTKPWLVRWYSPYDPTTDAQKRHSKSFAKRKQAERFAEQLEEDHEAGITPDMKNMTLGEFCDRYLRVKKNEYRYGTYLNYVYTIQRLKSYFNSNSPLAAITKEYAEQFVADITFIRKDLSRKYKKVSDSCRNVQLRNCKTMFSKAVDWDYLRINPFAHVKQVKAQKKTWHYISPAEFESILNVCTDPYKRAYYAVQYGCGLRAGEAVNLLWDGANIDFGSNQITIVNRLATPEIPPYTIKDFETRTVPMPDWVVKELLNLYQNVSEHNPFVFLSDRKWGTIQKWWKETQKDGRLWNPGNLLTDSLRDFKIWCRRAGVKSRNRLCQHSMRKSWATNLANAGVPIQTLMKMGGWSSIECCQQYYLKSTDENEKKAVRVLNHLFADREVGQEEGSVRDRTRQV